MGIIQEYRRKQDVISFHKGCVAQAMANAKEELEARNGINTLDIKSQILKARLEDARWTLSSHLSTVEDYYAEALSLVWEIERDAEEKATRGESSVDLEKIEKLKNDMSVLMVGVAKLCEQMSVSLADAERYHLSVENYIYRNQSVPAEANIGFSERELAKFSEISSRFLDRMKKRGGKQHMMLEEIVSNPNCLAGANERLGVEYTSAVEPSEE